MVDNDSNITAFIDGVSNSLGSYTRGTTTVNRLALGALVRGSASWQIDAKVQQVVVVSGIIDPADQALLEAYIAAKNGATL